MVAELAAVAMRWSPIASLVAALGSPANPADDALHDALIVESRTLRLVEGTMNAVERSGPQRDAAEPLQRVAAGRRAGAPQPARRPGRHRRQQDPGSPPARHRSASPSTTASASTAPTPSRRLQRSVEVLYGWMRSTVKTLYGRRALHLSAATDPRPCRAGIARAHARLRREPPRAEATACSARAHLSTTTRTSIVITALRQA